MYAKILKDFAVCKVVASQINVNVKFFFNFVNTMRDSFFPCHILLKSSYSKMYFVIAVKKNTYFKKTSHIHQTRAVSLRNIKQK